MSTTTLTDYQTQVVRESLINERASLLDAAKSAASRNDLALAEIFSEQAESILSIIEKFKPRHAVPSDLPF